MDQFKSKPFDSLVVVGKIHKLGTEPVELKARVALAACMMVNSPPNVLLISAGGSYLPDTDVPVAQIVKQWAMEWGVSKDRIVTSNESNSTIREVKIIKELLGKFERKTPLIISHNYHLRRTQAYCQEIGLDVQMLGCSVKTMDQILPKCSSEMRDVIQRGQMSVYGAIKEFCVETILSLMHVTNPSGKLECWLADRFRKGMLLQNRQ